MGYTTWALGIAAHLIKSGEEGEIVSKASGLKGGKTVI